MYDLPVIACKNHMALYTSAQIMIHEIKSLYDVGSERIYEWAVNDIISELIQFISQITTRSECDIQVRSEVLFALIGCTTLEWWP